MKKKTIIAVSVLAGLLCGFFLGLGFGIELTIRKVVNLLPSFTNIEINTQTVKDALFQYSNNIGKCFNRTLG